jgi:hypothetical protein
VNGLATSNAAITTVAEAAEGRLSLEFNGGLTTGAGNSLRSHCLSIVSVQVEENMPINIIYSGFVLSNAIDEEDLGLMRLYC